MPLIVASTSQVFPSLSLQAFEGPLDLLLHLIREHKVEITDIPILQVTEQYLAYLRAMEELNLVVAGEFVVMAATLIEIKSRALLPKPPKIDLDEFDGEDPEQVLIQRLLDYQRYKSLVATLESWEINRRSLLFRGEADYGGQYELPIAFGSTSSEALVRAFRQVLDRIDVDDPTGVTSVRRQKMTLKLSMATLLQSVRGAGDNGIALEECFPRPLMLIEVVMTFLGVLELLRQQKISALQAEWMNTIMLYMTNNDNGQEPLNADEATDIL